MGETLLQFPRPIEGPDGTRYEARACAAPMEGKTWQAWIEFVPLEGGAPVRSPRETTQPNRTDTEYWATGLTDVYLEGALRRALDTRVAVEPLPPQPSLFSGPADAAPLPADNGAPTSILDPFSVFEKGEALLRKQLGALSAWHLVNIVREYELSDLSTEVLNHMPAPSLAEIIVAGVRAEVERSRPA